MEVRGVKVKSAGAGHSLPGMGTGMQAAAASRQCPEQWKQSMGPGGESSSSASGGERDRFVTR